jgi:uncharacterized protein YlaI
MQGKSKPERGQGHRALNCAHYDNCLNKAAKANWKTWRCSHACPFYDGQQKDTKPTKPKPTNTRICDDCKEKITISPNSSLCPSCMAKRSNAKAKAKKEPEPPKPGDESTGKRPPESSNFRRSRSPEAPTPFSAKSPVGSNGTLLIEFGRHGHEGILRKVEKLAEDELRSVDLQVVYMLREQLKSVLTDH